MRITSQIVIDDSQLQWRAIRAQGSGGQNVNKVSTAVVLTFDIHRSSLPEQIKQRLLQTADHRISQHGVVTIKAQQYRSQELNRADAYQRLQQLLQRATKTEKKRTATKPSKNARKKRVDRKTQRGKTKQLRGRVRE
ncbi:MAG: aminoacyl-tRNA hydrolase [Desulfuromonas sp.]|nr:aminoacyl-tRNA hydrolase [Desulfuromonas sp.]